MLASQGVILADHRVALVVGVLSWKWEPWDGREVLVPSDHHLLTRDQAVGGRVYPSASSRLDVGEVLGSVPPASGSP